MESNMFDKHEILTRFRIVEAVWFDDKSIKPSVYITEIKLRKAFKDFTEEEIEDLFEMEFLGSRPALDRHRKKLNEKIELLHDWQLFKALEILLEVGRIECAEYVIKCKRADVNE